MNLDEAMAYGAPFREVQIELSMKKHVVRIIIPRGDQALWLDLAIPYTDVAAAEVITAVRAVGADTGLLVKKNLQLTLVDLDLEVEN